MKQRICRAPLLSGCTIELSEPLIRTRGPSSLLIAASDLRCVRRSTAPSPPVATGFATKSAISDMSKSCMSLRKMMGRPARLCRSHLIMSTTHSPTSEVMTFVQQFFVSYFFSSAKVVWHSLFASSISGRKEKAWYRAAGRGNSLYVVLAKASTNLE